MSGMVRQEIEQRARAFEAAFNGGDMAALAALYTEDAALLPPDSDTLTGRPAIERFWQGVRDSGVQRIGLSTQQVVGDGDVVAEVGTAELTVGADTVPVKYVVAWQRQGDGPWQLAVDIWNSRPNS